MRLCPLCSLEIDESDLVRHYLNDPKLVAFIEKANPGWTPAKGACSRCLETYFAQYTSTSLPRGLDETTEERTVITPSADLLPNAGAPAGTPSLIVIHGVDLGKKFDLVHEQTLVGRGETTHIRINEENVSRLHALILKKGTEVILEDQNSTNGTFVNTRKVKSKPLGDGDLVLIGNTILKFMSESSMEHQYHEEIYRLATQDGLTQIANKNFFLDRLSEEFSRSKRYDRELSLLMFDFDHFKAVNDTYGHLAGDEILKKAAGLIQKNMRKEDVVGRYGGEEFAVILPETPKKNAVFLAEKLRKLIEGTTFTHGTFKIPVTISIGVATIAKEIRSPEQFLEAADKALYQAKSEGRNCVR
jgi:diguanylate cyclase (GGDEF)-like protein